MVAELIVWIILYVRKVLRLKMISVYTARSCVRRHIIFRVTLMDEQLSVTPLVGLGKSSLLNKTIFHLMPCAEHKAHHLYPLLQSACGTGAEYNSATARRKESGNHCWR
ncbi:phosphatidylserine synthase [Salmonella enterica subsp. arizonae]|uniref:Phosphatidylserine synthase n=1 Tax=Salmonella enterica subsp. arizonae TaxID=59203 RepID=A0A2X4T4L5_SALER|nr:phosphatidylserine synthase [Salmonella enterica subsp. arizonae]